MKNCKYCKAEIATDASVCQHCSKDQRNRFVRHWIISTLLVLFIIGSVIGSQDSSTQTQTSTQVQKPKLDPISVSAKTLSKDYEDNEIKADEKYNGKELMVDGVVESIDVVLGKSIVRMAGHNMMMNVSCYLDDQSKSKASELKKGQSIRLIGIGNGKSLRPEIKDCVIQ